MAIRKKLPVIALAGVMFFSGVATAQLGDILKAGGIAFLVSRFGNEINKAINGLTGVPQHDRTFATKVVPVLSIGDGTAVGAVQVAGPRAAVNRVQAVAQVEGRFRPLDLRVRALIPIETKSLSNIRRVNGVGVSGLLDVQL